MTILREITNAKHREVEALPLIQTIMQGKVTKEQYVCYLYELANIYDVLETLAINNGILEGLPGIERTEKLQQDLEELNDNYHRPLTQASLDYISHLSRLSVNKETTHLLMAHVYVRHMGDLYGGKLMSRVVPGAGRAYQFDDRPGIIKAFNEKLTLELGNEANVAFDYFIRIFTELYTQKEFAVIT